MKKARFLPALILCVLLLLVSVSALADDPYLNKTSITLEVFDTEYISVRNLPSGTEAQWSSSNAKVASVNENGRVTAVSPGTATITARIEGYDDLTASVTVKDVSFSATDLSMKVGGFNILSVQGTYRYTSQMDIKWSSGNPNVVTIKESTSSFDKYSVSVIAMSPGKTVIKAVINGVYTLKTNVTVAAPTLNKTSATLLVGKSVDLSLSGHSLSGYDLEWTSSNPVVASVGGDNYNSTRNIRARSPGTATITVSYNKKKLASAKITVSEAKISPSSFELGVKKTRELKVEGIYSVAYNELKWTSSNTSVVKVDEYGVATGVSAGEARISVCINGGKTYSAAVTVVPAFASNKEYVAVGETLKLKLNGLPKGAKVKWKSSKSKIATVNKKGVVKAGKKPGKTTVSVKYGKKTYKVKVVVKPKVEATVRRITDTRIYNEVYLDFHNYSKKDIVYIKLNIAQYNNAGKKLKSPYDWYYLNDTVKAGKTLGNIEFWVHDDTKKVKITILEVTFKGGSKWKP